jgi:hypothetical protein
VLTLKSAWTDGTRQLLFEPLTLLGKLAALIPRPRINLVVYHGVLAPHCGARGWGPTGAAGGGEPVLRGDRRVAVRAASLGRGRR